MADYCFNIKVQTAKLKTQFGVPLKKLVPGKVVRVPMVLERMLQHLEQQGQCHKDPF